MIGDRFGQKVSNTHRRILIKSRQASLATSVSYITFENLVSMMPGAMQLTRILSRAKSTLSALVRPIKAVLLTEYAPSN